MTSAAQSTPTLHVLRGILRLLKTPDLPPELGRKKPVVATVQTDLRPSKNHQSPTRAFVLDRYRASQQERREDEIQRLRAMAFNYFQLQKDLHERARLYQLDSGAEVVFTPKELSRRAAARSGLQLPKLNPDLDKID